MSRNKPLIGVTPWFDYDKQTAFIKRGYCEGIIKAGGVPLILPVTEDEEILYEAAKRCNGFLLSGGPDVDAQLYGEHNLVYNGEISPVRDVLELYIAKKSVEDCKPVLGICRGIQIMNVAFGGTLYQDIGSQVNNALPIKHTQEAPKWYPTHEVIIEKDSRVWSWFEAGRAGVNSFHHQAVKDVAPGFTVTSRAPDGIIESIELTGHRFAIGVQWHPELMWQESSRYLTMFIDFINECKTT